MSTDSSPNQFPAEDFRATATAFSQLAGVLGGFCITIGIFLFTAGHILLASTLTILVYQFSSTVGIIAVGVIVIVVLVNALLNFRFEFGILRTKQ